MRPSANPELVLKGLKLERLMVNLHRVSIYLSSTAPCASRCVCGRYFRRVHSRHERTIANLPWHGVPVTLHPHSAGCRHELKNLCSKDEDALANGAIRRV